jgi:hypothetical protein
MTSTAVAIDELIRTTVDRFADQAAAHARMALDVMRRNPRSPHALRAYVIASAQHEELTLRASTLRRLTVPAASVIDNMRNGT